MEMICRGRKGAREKRREGWMDGWMGGWFAAVGIGNKYGRCAAKGGTIWSSAALSSSSSSSSSVSTRQIHSTPKGGPATLGLWYEE